MALVPKPMRQNPTSEINGDKGKNTQTMPASKPHKRKRATLLGECVSMKSSTKKRVIA